MSYITVHRGYVEQSSYLLYYTSVVSRIIKNGLSSKVVKSKMFNLIILLLSADALGVSFSFTALPDMCKYAYKDIGKVTQTKPGVCDNDVANDLCIPGFEFSWANRFNRRHLKNTELAWYSPSTSREKLEYYQHPNDHVLQAIKHIVCNEGVIWVNDKPIYL